LAKNDIKIREKIKDLEMKRDEQEQTLYGHIKRLTELQIIEDRVRSNDEAYKKMLEKEQIAK
jgi:DNA-binding transcriptional ArsR family regulator